MNAENVSNDADLIPSPWPVLTRPVVDGFNPARDRQATRSVQWDRAPFGLDRKEGGLMRSCSRSRHHRSLTVEPLEARILLSGPAAQLAFVQPPTNARAGSIIAPAVTVDVEDANGHVVTSNNSDVTLSIVSPATDSGVLSGTLTEQAVNGVATFSNLSISSAGIYTLQATDTEGAADAGDLAELHHDGSAAGIRLYSQDAGVVQRNATAKPPGRADHGRQRQSLRHNRVRAAPMATARCSK